MPPPEEVVEEAIPQIDIKSRIAAFSKGAATQPVSSGVPTEQKLRKVPSTSQLLPAWQQRQHQLQVQKEEQGLSISERQSHLLKPSQISLNRPRSTSGGNQLQSNSDRGNTEKDTTSSPKLGVKSIIALYGQQSPATATHPSPSQSKESKVKEKLLIDDNSQFNNDQDGATLQSNDTAKRAVPFAPALPPRPRNNVLLSQSNTGSSSTSSSSNSVSNIQNGGTASPTSSGYAPYVRKNLGGSQSPAGMNNVPALPPRSWAARSSEDLTLASSDPSRPSANQRRMMGAGPSWASSSSGNLTTQMEQDPKSIMPPPAVPPRANTGMVANSLIPPPKRSIATPTQASTNAATSSRVHRSTSGPIAATSPSNGGGGGGGNQSRLANRSSLSSMNPSSSSTVIVPPPRHIDALRMGPATHVSTSSASSLRSIKQAKPKRKKKRAGLVYSREASEAEQQRYAAIFDRLIEKQEEKGKRGNGKLEKRIVDKIWRQSRLEDWFLARVWDQAVAPSSIEEDSGRSGLAKPTFIKAMCAIDYELQRRKEERQAQSRTA